MSANRLVSLQVLTHIKKLKLVPQILLVLWALHLTPARPSILPTCPQSLQLQTQVCFHRLNSAVMKPKLLQTSLTLHLQEQLQNTFLICRVFQLKQQQLLPTNAKWLQLKHKQQHLSQVKVIKRPLFLVKTMKQKSLDMVDGKSPTPSVPYLLLPNLMLRFQNCQVV